MTTFKYVHDQALRTDLTDLGQEKGYKASGLVTVKVLGYDGAGFSLYMSCPEPKGKQGSSGMSGAHANAVNFESSGDDSGGAAASAPGEQARVRTCGKKTYLLPSSAEGDVVDLTVGFVTGPDGASVPASLNAAVPTGAASSSSSAAAGNAHGHPTSASASAVPKKSQYRCTAYPHPHTTDTFESKYLVQLLVQDMHDLKRAPVVVTVFEDLGRVLYGRPSSEYVDLYDGVDEITDESLKAEVEAAGEKIRQSCIGKVVNARLDMAVIPETESLTRKKQVKCILNISKV